MLYNINVRLFVVYKVFGYFEFGRFLDVRMDGINLEFRGNLEFFLNKMILGIVSIEKWKIVFYDSNGSIGKYLVDFELSKKGL